MRICPYLEMGEMPEFITTLLALAKDDVERDMMLMSILTACSSALPNLYFRHGGMQKKYHANLMCFIEAPAAQGKSIAGIGTELLRPIDKANPLFIAGNSTHAAFVERLNEKEGVGYSYTSEGSVITNIWKRTGCSGYSDLMRQAAEHETITVSRKNQPEVVIENPRLSMLITGTFDQFRAFLPSAQNGLFSRIIPLVIREKAVFDARVYLKGLAEPEDGESTPQVVIARQARKLLGLYERLFCAEKPVLFQWTPEQARELGEMFQQEGLALMDKLGPNFHSCVARTAVNTERIAMILTALRHLGEDADETPAATKRTESYENYKLGTVWTCDERDYRTACVIGQKILFHVADAFTQVGADKEEAIPAARGSWQRDTFYETLPEEFETGECLANGKKMGIGERTLMRWLSQWKEAGLVYKSSRGIYQKVA